MGDPLEMELAKTSCQAAVLAAAWLRNAGSVLSVHRRDATTDYYWLYNQGSVISAGAPGNSYDPIPAGTAVDTTFTLTGSGVPLRLNTWDGSITPITQYRAGNGTVTVQVKLAPEDTTVIVLTSDRRPGNRHQQAPGDAHSGRPYLHAGTNTLEVTVSTTLINR